MRIQRAGRRDAGRLALLVAALAATRSQAPGPVSQARLARELARPDRLVLVATDGGRPLGLAGLHILRSLAHNGRRWALLEDLIVAEDARGRTIAAALLAEAERRARRLGCYKISLSSRSSRRAAHALYRKAGFERFGHGFRLLLDDQRTVTGSKKSI